MNVLLITYAENVRMDLQVSKVVTHYVQFYVPTIAKILIDEHVLNLTNVEFV